MASGTLFLALLATAQSPAPPPANVRSVASASVTIIAAEEISFTPAKIEKRTVKFIRRGDKDRVLIEFF